MKTKLATALFTLAAALAFADEPTFAQPLSATDLPKETKSAIAAEKVSSNKSFAYFRMGVTESMPLDSVQFIPDVGMGYRINTGNGAIDLSGNYTHNLKKEGGTYFFTAPKAAYLHYITPSKNQSVYGGLGVAFGGLKTKDQSEFLGLIPSATVGLEMNRSKAMPVFAQLDVSQPAFDVKDVDFVKLATFRPVAEFSVGAGF